MAKPLKFLPCKRGLAHLVKSLAKENDVVILVDEYDKPIIDHLSDPEVTKAQ